MTICMCEQNHEGKQKKTAMKDKTTKSIKFN